MAKKIEPRKGRPSANAGKKILKLSSEGLRGSSRRLATYKGIRQGMSYEAFVDGGGSVVDLKALVAGGKVKVELQ